MGSTKKNIAVSVLKAQLLEIVRKVEKGESFQITKDGHPVAELRPIGGQTSAVGFAKGKVLGPLDLDISDDFEFDEPNLTHGRMK